MGCNLLLIVILRCFNFAFALVLSFLLYDDSKMFYSFFSHLVIAVACLIVNAWLEIQGNVRINEKHSDFETEIKG